MLFSFCVYLWLLCGIMILFAYIYDTEKTVAIITGIASFILVTLVFRYDITRLPDGADFVLAIIPISSWAAHIGIAIKYKTKGVAYLLLAVLAVCFIILYLVLDTGINKHF